ncbi:MAG: PHP domain-containing protein [Chloroflexi bacterium]|nr:PHP domain-containing protein [Chloroflexota bacterium]
MGKADLHIHSAQGDGMATVSQILEYVEHETDLDLIAITDHDDIRGGLEARDLAVRGNYRFDVLVGLEITTLEGHLLAYDVETPFRMMRSLDATIRKIHEHGGFCIVPHPMSWLTRSIGRNGLRRILVHPDPLVYFDGIEIINPSIAGRIIHEKARRLNATDFHLPETAGSDSHTLSLVGTAYTQFPGRTADDYRTTLKRGQVQASGAFWGTDAHRELLRIAGRQVFKSWVILPGQHIRDSWVSRREKRVP